MNPTTLLPRLGRRIRLAMPALPVIVTPPAGSSSILRVSLSFATAAEAQAATLTPTNLKYDKSACVMYDMDDSVVDLYSKVFPILSNITYTDGAGGVVNYRATGALQGHDSFGQVMMDGSNPSKFTWANSLAMVAKGWDMALHSDLHTDANPSADVQLDTLLALATNRYAALGSSYKLRSGIVPSNYADYIPGFIRLGCPPGSLSSQGTAGSLTLLPVFSEDVTFQYSAIPTSGHFMMRRSLTDPGNAPLSVEQAAIDDLVTGTTANPKIFRCYSHQEVPNITENIFTYVKGKPGDLIWMPSLREFGEYRETRVGTVLTKTVSGTTATWNLDQSALSPDVRWRDLTYRISGGTATSATLAGGRGLTLAGSLLNVYNSDVVPAGIAASVTNGAGAPASTPTPAPAPTPTPVPTSANAPAVTVGAAVTGLVPLSQLRVAHNTFNLDESQLAVLFSNTTDNRVNLGDNIGTPTTRLLLLFHPLADAVLHGVRERDGSGSSTGDGTSPLLVGYLPKGSDTAVAIGTFDGNGYGVTDAYPAADVAVDGVVLGFQTTKPTCPAGLGINATYNPVTVSAYPRKRVLLADQYGLNTYLYSYDTPAKADARYAFGFNRVYTNINYLYGNAGATRQETNGGPLLDDTGSYRFQTTRQANGDLDALFAGGKAAGCTMLLTILNNTLDQAHTFRLADGSANQDDDTVPRAFSGNPYSAAAYARHREIAYQAVARYAMVAVPAATLKSANTPLASYHTVAYGYPAARVETQKTGLATVRYFEIGNELNKTWKALLSFLDPVAMAYYWVEVVAGAREADPAAIVVFPAYYFEDTSAFALFCRTLSQLTGSLDSIRVFNWHHYDTTGAYGIAPELSASRIKIRAMLQLAAELVPNAECWMTETGYSVGINSFQTPPATATRTIEQRQSDLNQRIGLRNARYGITRTALYQDSDDQKYIADPTTPEFDKSMAVVGRLSERTIRQTRGLMLGYTGPDIIQNSAENKAVAYIDRYTKAGAPDIYVVWVGDEHDVTIPFTIDLPNVPQLTKCTLQETGLLLSGTTTSISGSYSGTATEQPTFYYLGVPDSSVVTVAAPAPSAAYTTATPS